MAREMTPQERAAALLSNIVGIVPMTEQQRATRVQWLVDYAKTTRQEALRELRKRLEKREQFYTEQEAQSEGQMRLTRGLQRNEASGCIAELDRLASEGA